MIGYVTVGHADDRRAFAAIEAACEEAGWLLAEIVHDRGTARALDRPGLSYALKQVAAGHARGLVVSDLRRLTRSLAELGALLQWFRDADAALVALDLDLDTTTPNGREVAASLLTVSGWERDRIARRTRRGMARVRSQGRTTGRPAVRDRPELVERITEMRRAGLTLQAIADRLNAEAIPTLRGGAMWRPSSVQAALGYRRPRSRWSSARPRAPGADEEGPG
jgi:DNA invertase Pin-like site-specific DNA recombinase